MNRILNGLLFFSISACTINLGEKADSKSTKERRLQNGIVKTNYPNGSLHVEISYTDGRKNGKAKEYYKGGKLYMEIDYTNDIKHGWAYRYWQNGKLYQETPYDSGLIHGTQKKYREDGKLAAEIPFYKDNQCIGIKEYFLDGTLKGDYPKIIINPIDNLWRDSEYILRLSMSDKSRAVEYYVGLLSDNKYIGENCEKVFSRDKNGIAEVKFSLLPREFLMKEINIIAKVKTLQGNYFITQRKHNLAIENKN